MMTSSDAVQQVEGHELLIEEADSYAQRAGYLLYGECGCHNPDGDGVGRTDILAATRGEIEDWHQDHLLDLH